MSVKPVSGELEGFRQAGNVRTISLPLEPMDRSTLTIISLLLLLSACSSPRSPSGGKGGADVRRRGPPSTAGGAETASRPGTASERETVPERDPHSFADLREGKVRHLDLTLAIRFESRRILGRARLFLDRSGAASRPEHHERLTLDTRGLEIRRVTLGEEEEPARFSLGPEKALLGRPLVIETPPETSVVTVEYETSPGAAALQWLAPEQTADGAHPFLFTQSQAILARTWIPCQDTPAVRMTYKATVRVRPGLLVLMSAENPQAKSASGYYVFEMDRPIPSYLMALAAGDLEFWPLGDRSGVYAEPSLLYTAAREFADTERMIDVAERLWGPYRWGRYDVLVLPPSFPWGGMENPRLTFLTPTVIAGDGSLVALIAHELAHSWSGNLVTNATWNHFWVNEGFTVYLEQRIMEELYGRERAEMLASLALSKLAEEVERLGEDSPDTRLRMNLAGRDPEDGMSAISYEKGYFFLRHSEEVVGRDRWDAFLRKYFDRFAWQSVTSERFVAYLRRELIAGDEELAERLNVEDWVFGRGLPASLPAPSSGGIRRVEAAVERWLDGAPPASLRAEEWSTHEWLRFLRRLPRDLPPERLEELDGAFGFTATGNHEILCEWLLLAVGSGYERASPRLEEFLRGVGRLKFIRPLYEKLASTPEGRERAREIYSGARASYHPIAIKTLDRLLAGE